MNDELPLRDIHPALAADWWPLAPLVWGLLTIVLIGLLWSGVQLLRGWFRARRRAAMYAHLKQLHHAYTEHHDRTRLARDLSEWLRRLLLYRGGPGSIQIAALTGTHWSDYLSAPFADSQRLVTAAGQIATQPWQAKPDIDEAAVFDLAAAWIDRLSEAGHV